jgi:hypothetical protein
LVKKGKKENNEHKKSVRRRRRKNLECKTKAIVNHGQLPHYWRRRGVGGMTSFNKKYFD